MFFFSTLQFIWFESSVDNFLDSLQTDRQWWSQYLPNFVGEWNSSKKYKDGNTYQNERLVIFKEQMTMVDFE